MSKFSIPARYDPKEARIGVFFDIYDNVTDFYYGAFKCRHYDLNDPYFKVANERYHRVDRKELHGKNHSEDYMSAHYLVKTLLLDWKGVKDAKGKDAKFTEEDAIDYLSMPEARFLREAIFDCAKNPRLFRGDKLDTSPEEVAILNEKASLDDHKVEASKN